MLKSATLNSMRGLNDSGSKQMIAVPSNQFSNKINPIRKTPGEEYLVATRSINESSYNANWANSSTAKINKFLETMSQHLNDSGKKVRKSGGSQVLDTSKTNSFATSSKIIHHNPSSSIQQFKKADFTKDLRKVRVKTNSPGTLRNLSSVSQLSNSLASHIANLSKLRNTSTIYQ